VDEVVGTSMGAVVGGLFAAGATATEIEREALSIHWGDVFRGSPPRADLNYRRRQDDRTLPVQLELGFRDGSLVLPRGLVTGQNLSTRFMALTLPLGPVQDFDSLPVPFRAVAVDIGTGETVALGSGSLSNAIRASVAIPGVFVPVEIDGHLLVDGGLRNNLPIDVALRFDPDVIIAVDVATPPMARENLATALDISQQAFRFPFQAMTAEQTALLRPGRDVLIRPQLDSVRFTSFEDAPAAITAGERATERAALRLRQWSLSEDAYRRWREDRTDPEPPATVPAFVHIDNRSRMASSTLRETLGIAAHRPLDIDALTRGIDRIYGMGWFESVRVRWAVEAADTGLVVDVVPEPWGPNYVRFGLGFADDLGGNSAFDVLVSYTASLLNGWGGEARADVSVGRRRRFGLELYQPLGARSRLFVSPRLEWFRDLEDVFDGQVRVGQLRRTRYGGALDAGLELGNWGELRAGWWLGRTELDRRTGPIDSLETSTRVSALHLRLGVDRLDDRAFPTRGEAYRVGVERPFRVLGGETEYTRLSFHALKALTNRAGTLVAHGRVATSFDAPLPYWDAFELGGFLDVSGLRNRQVVGSELARLALTGYRPVATVPTTLAGGRLFVGASFEAGNAWERTRDIALDDLRLGGTVFAGLETFLGPAWLGYGRADRGSGAWYLLLGRTF
ncbi:MAG: patatin-like phospholipase family protein, partial [Gemmatimonadetes bacterium]|nr:patatin-like phospholipase family protein [Gemmatimonadota bacterium]